MKKFTRFLALSISILMMLSVLFGCKKENPDANTAETNKNRTMKNWIIFPMILILATRM